jgi:hypothetical protein
MSAHDGLDIILRLKSCYEHKIFSGVNAVFGQVTGMEFFHRIGSVRNIIRSGIVGFNEILLNAFIIGDEVRRMFYSNFFQFFYDTLYGLVPL